MATGINTYLHFRDNSEEAFNFYKSVFGGDFLMLQRHKEGPPGIKLKPEEENRILHVSLPVGKNVLMASDSIESMASSHDGWQLKPGNNFSLSVDAESKAEADRLHAALSSGGKVTMPMGDQFWGAYFGMCKDKFGIQWMISYTKPK
jgi:PhnB protein